LRRAAAGASPAVVTIVRPGSGAGIGSIADRVR